MTELIGIVGSVNQPSKTRAAVEIALEEATTDKDASTSVLHLAEYDMVTPDGRPLEDYEGDTAAVLERIVESDAYVIGTPVYRASYSGILKDLLDMVPRGKWMADVAPFENAAIGLVATGATPHHFLTVDTALRPLMGFFGSYAAGGVYAHDGHFDDERKVTDDDIRKRLSKLGAGTVELQRAIEESHHLSALGPQV